MMGHLHGHLHGHLLYCHTQREFERCLAMEVRNRSRLFSISLEESVALSIVELRMVAHGLKTFKEIQRSSMFA